MVICIIFILVNNIIYITIVIYTATTTKDEHPSMQNVAKQNVVKPVECNDMIVISTIS